MAQRIGFVGVGNMGLSMAKNLLKKGHTVTAYDAFPASLAKFAEAGGKTAKSPAAACEGADVVVTMLPSNQHVRDVYTGKSGVLESLRKGALCLDSSTIDPCVSRQVAAAVSVKGSDFCDAPVSGGVGGAEAGTLTFMVGADSAGVFQRALPVLQGMGKNVVHCGGVGTGEVVKLCNNMVLAISMIGVSEAMNLGSRLGMDRKLLAGILNTSTARCWSSDTYNPAPGVMPNVPASRGYTGGFGSALMLKDLGLVLDAAKGAGVPVPMGANAHALYQLMVAQGMGGQDFSAAFKFLGGLDEDPAKK